MVYDFGVSKAVTEANYLMDRHIGKITTYTVASYEETDKSSFDFESLHEALVYIGSLDTFLSGGVIISLGDGTHYVGSEQLIDGNYFYSYNNCNVIIEGASRDKSKVNIIIRGNSDVNAKGLFKVTFGYFSFKYVTVKSLADGYEPANLFYVISPIASRFGLLYSEIIGNGSDDNIVSIYPKDSTLGLVSTSFTDLHIGILITYTDCSGFIYNVSFTNVDKDINQGYSTGCLLSYNEYSKDNVSTPQEFNHTDKDGTFTLIDGKSKVPVRDERRVIADSSNRPTMDGIQDGVSILQLDIKKPIWYAGKNDDGDDIWIDATGTEV